MDRVSARLQGATAGRGYRLFELELSDLIILGFWSCFLLLTLLAAPWLAAWKTVFKAGFSLLAQLLVLYLLASYLLQRRELGAWRGAQALRFVAIAISLIFGHDALGIFLGNFGRMGYEGFLWKFDLWLFGAHPSVLLESVQHPWLTEWFQIWYTGYFFLPVPLGIALVMQNRRDDLQRYGFFLCAIIYTVFAGYVILPCRTPEMLNRALLAAGEAPLYDWSNELTGVWLAQPLRELIWRGSSNIWDAFPSGHTAISLLCAMAAWKYERRLFWPVAFIAAQVIASTVYLRYHYLLDLLISILFCISVYAVLEPLHDRLRDWVLGDSAAA